jgi:hypothetical protein
MEACAIADDEIGDTVQLVVSEVERKSNILRSTILFRLCDLSKRGKCIQSYWIEVTQ